MKREHALRTKPIDVWRQLQILSALEDARGGNGEGGRRGGSVDDDDGIERGGSANSSTGGGGGSDSKTAAGGGAGAAPAPKAKEIPTPQIDAVADYEALVEASYKLPESYIRTKKLPAILAPGVELEGLEYNLELEDEEWLKGHKIIGPKGELAGALDADRMERMMDELEKVTGAGEAIMLADAESVLEQRMGMQPIGSNKTVIAEVWGYWAAKRQRFKKPLLRRFWPITSINDTNPHLVFRPREKERYKLRRHRKNDGEAYRRLELLKRDFKQVQDLLVLVRKREQVKLALLKLQQEEFLQTIAELCGQQRTPQIPKEAPTAVRDRDDLKLKLRLPSHAAGSAEERRKKRQREEAEREAREREEQLAANPELERMRRPVAWGTKEKDGAMPTPDYLPSFMEDFRLRQAGRAPPRRALPYADEAECSYGWRTVGGSGSRGLSLRGGPGGGRGGGSLGRRVGHLRSGVVGSGWGGGWPIDYDEPVGGEAVRYRCRARLARGGRIVFDRVPLLQTQHQPAAAAATAATATPAAPQQEKTAAAAAAASASSSSMPPPPAPGGPQPAQHQHLHLSHPHPPSYRPLPAESITVALCAAPSLGPHLDKYPTCDLQSGDVFRYPTRFPEILKVDDAEDEVVERDPLAPSDPDPLLVLPPKPRPPETDSVALLRFQLRV